MATVIIDGFEIETVNIKAMTLEEFITLTS